MMVLDTVLKWPVWVYNHHCLLLTGVRTAKLLNKAYVRGGQLAAYMPQVAKQLVYAGHGVVWGGDRDHSGR